MDNINEKLQHLKISPDPSNTDISSVHQSQDTPNNEILFEDSTIKNEQAESSQGTSRIRNERNFAGSSMELCDQLCQYLREQERHMIYRLYWGSHRSAAAVVQGLSVHHRTYGTTDSDVPLSAEESADRALTAFLESEIMKTSPFLSSELDETSSCENVVEGNMDEDN